MDYCWWFDESDIRPQRNHLNTPSAPGNEKLWKINYDNYLPRGPMLSRRTQRERAQWKCKRICVNYYVLWSRASRVQKRMQTRRNAKRDLIMVPNTFLILAAVRHTRNWLHAGKRSALCFIIFFCYHKLCHQHWEFIEFIEPSSRAETQVTISGRCCRQIIEVL